MRLYVHLSHIVTSKWKNFLRQCEILWFPECGPRSWDFGRRLWEQSWSKMLEEGWLPCCDILSSPWVSSQVGLSNNIYRTFLSQQMVPLVQTSAWKLWKRQFRHWWKEVCCVLSHPTLAIRYHYDGNDACHGPEGGPLTIYHQHEAPADLRVCITHIGFRLVTLISSPLGSWVWGCLACLRWFKIQIIPTLSRTLQHHTIAKSMRVILVRF